MRARQREQLKVLGRKQVARIKAKVLEAQAEKKKKKPMRYGKFEKEAKNSKN